VWLGDDEGAVVAAGGEKRTVVKSTGDRIDHSTHCFMRFVGATTSHSGYPAAEGVLETEGNFIVSWISAV
jgi:hypothetical protein